MANLKPPHLRTPQEKLAALGMIEPEFQVVGPTGEVVPKQTRTVNVDLSPSAPPTVRQTVTDNFPTLPNEEEGGVSPLTGIEKEVEDAANMQFADEPSMLDLPDAPQAAQDEYAAAAQQELDNKKKLALAQFGSQIGTALAGGGKYTAQNPIANLDQLKPLVGGEIDKLVTRDKAQEGRAKLDTEKVKSELNKTLSNPLSEESSAARESYANALEKIGQKEQADKIRNGNVSAASLESVYGNFNLSNMLQLKEAAAGRLAAAQAAAAGRAGDRELKQEAANLNWADRTAKELSKNPFIADYRKVKKNAMQFDNALNNPSGVADIASLYSYVKFLDTESAVREGEIDLVLAAVGGIDQIKLKMQKAIASGNNVEVIPKNMISAMRKANELVKRKLAKDVKDEIGRVKLQAERRGADIRTAIPNYDDFYEELERTSSGPATTFPMQVRKDGKTATVNSEEELQEAKSEGWN